MAKALPRHDDMYYSGLPYTQYKQRASVHVVKYYPTLEIFTCSCKDFNHRRRKTNEMCKHIELFNHLDETWEKSTSKKDGLSKQTFFQSKMVSINDVDTGEITKNREHDTSIDMSCSYKSRVGPHPVSVTTAVDEMSTAEACSLVKDLVGVSRSALSTVDTIIRKLEHAKIG